MSGRIMVLPSGGGLYIDSETRISTKIDTPLRFGTICTIWKA
ncbi:hypothetical protein GMO_15320 [Gluconobacter morbifer G707]|uniref:Uncharacterized protein n=1 Tax=Gluconobacter morbifer G707 TaxID=1088869 RepID=G6XJ66_9PROT|nr:hypothetical protein GMO_15320 [Gluconobacter morbifer G707]